MSPPKSSDLEETAASAPPQWAASDLARILEQKERHANFLRQVDFAAREPCTCGHRSLEHAPTCRGAWVDRAINRLDITPIFWAVRTPAGAAMLFRPCGRPAGEDDWHIVRNRWFGRCQISFLATEYPVAWTGKRAVIEGPWLYQIPVPISPPPVLRPTDKPQELIRHLLI